MSKLADIFKNRKDRDYEVVVITDPKSVHAENYRRIPINIKYIDVDNEPRIIQISSSLPAEFKTSISVNLAACYGELNYKAIVVDCDLRRPKVHRATKLLNDAGITDYLVDEISYDELIRKTEFGFDVITAGSTTPYPNIVLSSEKYKNLIKKLREEYDYVIIDSPPVLSVTDSLIISENVDTVLFVVNQRATKKSEVKEALRMFEDSNTKIGGIILSNVDKKLLGYSYYRTNYYSE